MHSLYIHTYIHIQKTVGCVSYGSSPNLSGLLQGDGAVVQGHVPVVGQQALPVDGGDVAVVQAGVEDVESSRLLQNVRMYVCMYVCMYVFVYVCIT